MKVLKPVLRKFCTAILGGCVASLVCLLLGADWRHTTNPYAVVAGDLHALPSAAYIQWPTNLVGGTTNRSPWRIGILGADPFGESLAMAVQNRPVDGRDFEIVHALRADELLDCHIVYLATKDEAKLGAALTVFAHHPVLTVGEVDDFLKLGGMIRLDIDKRVKLSLNLDRTDAEGFKIRADMLEIASEVIQNGRVKKMK
jgi:hypothetical protein